MKERLKTKRAVVGGLVVAGLIVLLGALIVVWIVDRNSSSCPGEYATSFNQEGDTWCTPKSEFCEKLRRVIDEDGNEDDEANFRQNCAEFAEPEE